MRLGFSVFSYFFFQITLSHALQSWLFLLLFSVVWTLQIALNELNQSSSWNSVRLCLRWSKKLTIIAKTKINFYHLTVTIFVFIKMHFDNFIQSYAHGWWQWFTTSGIYDEKKEKRKPTIILQKYWHPESTDVLLVMRRFVFDRWQDIDALRRGVLLRCSRAVQLVWWTNINWVSIPLCCFILPSARCKPYSNWQCDVGDDSHVSSLAV